MKHLKILDDIAVIAKTGSIRRSSELLHITPSALTRKIQDFEHELGTKIFERSAQGMRLNAAGELLIRHIRNQKADFERLRSQIADLSGIRRGHINVACSQAFASSILPVEIEKYRRQYPQVSFSVQVKDHKSGIEALQNYEADLALLIQPPVSPDIQPLIALEQPLCALMRQDHALASRTSVRLRDCFQYPLAMPDSSLAIRHLLDVGITRTMLKPEIMIESGSVEFLCNYTLLENVISFQIASGLPHFAEKLAICPIDKRDLAPVPIFFCHLRGRSLSVAAAKFSDQLIACLMQDKTFHMQGKFDNNIQI